MPQIDDPFIGRSVEALERSFLDNLYYSQGRFQESASTNDLYQAAAVSVRDRLIANWIETIEAIHKQNVRVVCYFSAEFLLGPLLENNLLNLGLCDQAHQAASNLGWDMRKIIDQEPEPGLGNGGLGRLAACYLDSLSTLSIPAIGYGIRYEHGIFSQVIQDGWQVEMTDKWLQLGNPWELRRPERAVNICFGGHTEAFTDSDGKYRVRWVPDRMVKAVPYDTAIPGYETDTTNTLRLWSAEATESFDFAAFNLGDYFGAVHAKVQSETISEVLYPNDEHFQGKELRLEQQYFFASASLQDMIAIHRHEGWALDQLAAKWAVQMNDTHPSISVAELMRLLIDEHGMDWEPAWRITQETLGFTNHTLLPEALEKWPLSLFQSLLPRHLEIVYEINRRFLDDVRANYPGDLDRVRRMSLIDESGDRYVRMANLATVGSHAINGVARLHTELLKKDLLRDFYEMYPSRFSNKTNGVTPRRWMAVANPRLAALLNRTIGPRWLKDISELSRLRPLSNDAGFRAEWRKMRNAVKQDFAEYIRNVTGVEIFAESLYDVMVKRLHEYKRQHLNVLHIIALYHRIKQNPGISIHPRIFLFGGKAAPGYYMAKLIIKFINSVAEVVNHDPEVQNRLRVVFLPNYNVTSGQHVYPAADLSEQISLAGKEASGTGNMKFMMNGAVTIGTLDGANVEIREQVGAENFFLFGLTADQVYDLRARGYNPRAYYEHDAELRRVIDSVASGEFSGGDRQLFRPLVDSLLSSDPYMLFADFRSYVDCQDRVGKAFEDIESWTRMSILNTASSATFSSDRAIREYAADIWKVDPVKMKAVSSAAD
ncbi:MAG: glycogen/starch/alpha-glucan family phosphorylase [Bryobacteraceae bacterium]